MTPSRLAFVQEFERELRSPSLRDWFDILRHHEPALQGFGDPTALRRFLHSNDVDVRKPEVWRALVRGVQRSHSEQATIYVLGLLGPGLGNLVDEFDSASFDHDDLWQEAVRGALRALRNPRTPGRKEVLAGLAWDTRKHVCAWLRLEISKQESEAPLLGFTYVTNFEEALGGADAEALLREWCRRAGISSADAGLISATRLVGIPLSHIERARSQPYDRLLKRRSRAEARLGRWLGLQRLRMRTPKNSLSENGR